MSLEQIGVMMLALSALISFSAYVWCLIEGFGVHWSWGVGMLVLGPIVAIPFLIMHRAQRKWPLRLFAASLLLSAIPYAANAIHARYIPDGPIRITVPVAASNPATTQVAGNEDHQHDPPAATEIHLTYTGVAQPNYATIAESPTAKVVQMANPDVTDETLQHLSSLTGLRELDLDHTSISDAGLECLQKFTGLEDLRLGHTGITDAGFRQHILPIKSLKRLNLIGTAVSSATVREWKAAGEGRKCLH